MKQTIAVLGLCAAMAWPTTSRAFCGFYVSGADASLYNNATMVVMMREGTRTVLSMQNNYQGPPEDFAMVVPVPVVLQEENVKTLPRQIFSRVDKLAAPRLVEYWEQDPCRPMVMEEMAVPRSAKARRSMGAAADSAEDYGVTIEAQFKVAEYDIVILSAKDSGGLDKWLRKNKYNIPKGANKVLRPYVEQNTKFFVAKVDAEKVKFQDGKAVLSPLRFHYDAPTFTLPVRLGLLNSGGQQDLIVHILAKGQRYEVANYKNTSIPTNIRVDDSVRQTFGGFYNALFERTVEKNPGAVVTEYSWDATSCDPCPEPPLTPQELTTLGGDVIIPGAQDPYSDIPGVVAPKVRRVAWQPYGFVLTRLHYRYDKSGLDEDLVFRTAGPIVGGRGMPDQNGDLHERRAQASGMNNFQGRYVILHRWEGAIACQNPQRGIWGGPPGRPQPKPFAAPNTMLEGGTTRTLTNQLPGLIQTDIPELDLKARPQEPEPKTQDGSGPASGDTSTSDGCSVSAARTASLGWIALIMVAMWLTRRRAVY
ncbi:MAG: DUF2330 domain-containing protein [Myxococcales bacterium]|jgi:hypothetical protein|nr:DUF2330 domain-containing protein [Myxococcales bacterium]MDH3843651.1 DUF2330 domain-containing protein [Myxococcales bacterium]